MTVMNKLVVLTTFFLLASCRSTEVTPGSERVRVLDAEPKGCLFVGEVASVQEDKSVGTLETEMDLATRIDLRNKAHALGGNILVFLKGKRTGSLPGSAPLPTQKSAAKPGGGKADDSQKAADTSNQKKDEVKTLVFIATVFKCPSSILNQ